MRKLWLRWGRALWVLLALNAWLVLGLTLWVTAQQLSNPSPRIVTGLTEAGISLTAYSAFFYITTVLSFLPFFIVALLIYLRRSHDGFALFVSIFLLNYGAAISYPQYAEFLAFYLHPPLWYYLPFNLANLLSWPLLIAFIVLFPDGQFQPRWTLYVSIGSAIISAAWTLNPALFTDFSSPIAVLGGISVLFWVGAAFYARIWRYRHYASPIERQQTKWFLFAIIILVLSALVYFLPPLMFGDTRLPSSNTSIWSDFGSVSNQVGYLVLPIAVGISILRYRLWDIDVLIRRTLTYAILSAFLALIYFGSIIALQRLFSLLTGGEQNEIVTVVSTLAIAALFVPLRSKIQQVIDQRFYRKKYDAQQVLSEFAETVRDETDLNQLSARLIQVVQETMQPKSVSVWLNEQDNPSK